MPARHTSPQNELLLIERISTGGSGRRKRVSARHQVKRLDRTFRRVRSFENRSGRRNRFSSFGADPMIRNFTGGRKAPTWNLVLTCSPTPSFSCAVADCVPRAIAQLPTLLIWSPAAHRAAGLQRVRTGCCARPLRGAWTRTLEHADDGVARRRRYKTAPMVIVWRNARVNQIPQMRGNPHEQSASAISRSPAPIRRLRRIHREP